MRDRERLRQLRKDESRGRMLLTYRTRIRVVAKRRGRAVCPGETSCIINLRPEPRRLLGVLFYEVTSPERSLCLPTSVPATAAASTTLCSERRSRLALRGQVKIKGAQRSRDAHELWPGCQGPDAQQIDFPDTP